MNIQQVRNATIIVEYGGKKILIDPMLGKKGCMPPFPFSRNQHLRNPLHELPFPVEEVLKGVDAVLLTHLHDDHIDEAAYEMMPKDMRFFVQDENDRQVVMSHGFNHVEVVGDNTRVGEVSIQKAESQHGNFIMKYPAGHTAGYVFTHPQEKTLYHAGDTIWYAGVKRNLRRFRPEVITLNAGGNGFRLGGRVIMNDEDVVKVAAAAPDAKLFVTHLEGVNHNSVTREMVRKRAEVAGILDRVFIPEDGETVENL